MAVKRIGGFLLAALLCCLIASGCSKSGISLGGFQISGLSSDELLCVGEETCPLSEAMIFVTSQKSLYQESFGADIWNVALEGGDFETYEMCIRDSTRDHSWVEEMVADGKMARGSESYWEKKNIITRAVGIDDTATADFFEIDLKPGERILLCSDGLTNMVEDEEIERILSMPDPLEELGKELMEEGKRNGGRDNISVILVEPELDEVNIC